MIGSICRRIGFWSLDFLRGGIVYKHYKDISDEHDRQRELDYILDYAKKNVPFYQGHKFSKLDEFPVMNKENYLSVGKEQFYSTEFNKDDLHHVFTSGSTGNPFEVVQDFNKRKRVVADLIKCHNSIGWKLGDKFIFARNWVSNYNKSKLKSFCQNVLNINVTDFSESKKMELATYLQKHKRCVLFGYASAIVEFMLYLEEKHINGIDLRIKLIVTDSDELSATNKDKLSKFFSAPVFNRYDNEENGLLGISKSDDNRLYLNTQSLYFELLGMDDDKPVKPGEIGRIVVTDLFNKAMPLIRYDTGDLGVSYDDSYPVKIIDSLAGRKAGVLKNQNGELVSDVSISGAIEPFITIKKYQIIQKDDTYTIKYRGKISDKDLGELKQRFYSCFGENVNLIFTEVDSFLISKNGKFKTTINESSK